MMAEYAEIRREMEKGNFSPVYFLQGEETFFVDQLTAIVEKNALEESQKGFNQVIIYGRDSTLPDIIGAAKRYPMMGERSVVIVKEAQDLKDWKKDETQKMLISYLEQPLTSTILLFAYKYKSLDKRTKIGKALEQNSTFLHAKKMYDNKIPEWISNYCNSKKVKIENPAVQMLAENIGNNLQRLSNEIDKLCLNLAGQDSITPQLVHTYVGISKDYNIFELQKSLSFGDRLKAQKIVAYFAANPSNNPLVLTISGLFGYFNKLLLVHHAGTSDERSIAAKIGVNPFFVKEYLQAARNYPIQKVAQNIKFIYQADLQSKGIASAPIKEGQILKELIYKLMH